MKKIVITSMLFLLGICAIQASQWDGPMGIYLKTNTSSNVNNVVSTNYRITSTNWPGNSLSSTINGCSELDGANLGTITSLKLDGGIYVGGTDKGGDAAYPHHWYDENGFKVQYCVYRQGENAPSWDDCEEMALDNKETDDSSGSNRDYVFNATGKDINLIALTNGAAGTYVLRVRMHKVKHYWNEDNSNGTWSENTEPQEAIFTIENYITGTGSVDVNNSFCGGENWWAKYDAGKISDGSRTYTNVAAGTYRFKIITGSWENEYGYSLLDTENSDINITSDGNSIKFTTDATSDITINFDASTGKVSLTSTLGRFVRTPYSLTGYGLFANNWVTNDTETEMTRMEDGTYQYILRDKELSARSYGYRVIGEHGWSVQYPISSESAAQVVISEAGTYTIVFQFDPLDDAPTCIVHKHYDVSISAYQFSTFYSDKAYILPEGLQAWIFTGVEGDMLTMQAIDLIPANTGVVLYGAANETYTLLETNTDVTYPANLLKGTTTDTEIINSCTHYILGVYNGDCGLFWPNGTTEGVGAFTNAAGKAYLELGGATPAPARIRGFVLSDHKTPTAVEDVRVQNNTDVYYDMLGRQVRNPQQGGIYIRGGKKVIAQ